MTLITEARRRVVLPQPDQALLASSIAASRPRPHHTHLLETLQNIWPEASFHYQLTRRGWHRTGGLCSAEGERITQDAETWLHESYEASGEPFHVWLLQLEHLQPLVTQFNGRTHFFTATYANKPECSWQLEVEELQEVQSRWLIHPDILADSIADLLEPLEIAPVDGQALDAPLYRLGHLMHVREAQADAVNAPLLTRFFQQWCEGPGRQTAFHLYWFFQRHESRNRYGVVQQRLQPHAIKARQLKPFNWDLTQDVQGIAAQLRQFDRAAGFDSAWYFCLVAGNLVPKELVDRLLADWQEDYRYITELQVNWLRDWKHQPYTL